MLCQGLKMCYADRSSVHGLPQVLHANPGAYLQHRKHLVAMMQHYASALRVAQEVGHSAVRPPAQLFFTCASNSVGLCRSRVGCIFPLDGGLPRGDEQQQGSRRGMLADRGRGDGVAVKREPDVQVVLMDRVIMSGVHMTEQFQLLFICACLRLAALQENALPPSNLAISALTDFPGLCPCNFLVADAGLKIHAGLTSGLQTWPAHHAACHLRVSSAVKGRQHRVVAVLCMHLIWCLSRIPMRCSDG